LKGKSVEHSSRYFGLIENPFQHSSLKSFNIYLPYYLLVHAKCLPTANPLGPGDLQDLQDPPGLAKVKIRIVITIML